MPLTNIEIDLDLHVCTSIDRIRVLVVRELKKSGFHSIAQDFEEKTKDILVGAQMREEVDKILHLKCKKPDTFVIKDTKIESSYCMTTRDGRVVYKGVITIDSARYELHGNFKTQSAAKKQAARLRTKFRNQIPGLHRFLSKLADKKLLWEN